MSCETCGGVTNRGFTAVWYSTSVAVPLTITVSGTGSTRTVTLQTLAARNYRIDLWLADINLATSPVTGTPPTTAAGGAGSFEWVVITDADGAASFTIEHTGARTWYLFADIASRVSAGVEVAF